MVAARLGLVLALAVGAGALGAGHGFSQDRVTSSDAGGRDQAVSVEARAASAQLDAGQLQVSDETPSRKVEVGAPIDFPPDTIVFIESGCSQCDGPPGPLYRASRIGEGPFRLDKAFEVDRTLFPDGYVMHYDLTRDAKEITAFVCIFRNCGGLGWPDAGSEMMVYRSTDYGASWSTSAALSASRLPLGVTDRGTVALDGPSWTFSFLESGEQLPSPGSSERLFAMTVEHRLFWVNDNWDRWLDEDGSPANMAPEIGAPVYDFILRGDLPLVTYWADPERRGPRDYYITTRFDGDEQTFRFDRYLDLGGSIDERYVVVSIMLDFDTILTEPSLLDSQSGVLHPIAELADRKLGRNYIRAVVRGPFWRVTAPPGGCLMLNVAPRAASTHVACLPEGEIVTPIGHRRRYLGQDWVTLASSDGRSGWALSAYLER